jgi:gamma-glutamyltranspeptidase / glutathione hydrolase / leukotriene-C4 hydrolase
MITLALMPQIRTLISLLFILPLSFLASPLPLPLSHRREVLTSLHGAVAADDARCSATGRDALRDGGSAVDAAVTVALCLGVVSSASSGLGGGAFMLLHLSASAQKGASSAWAFDMRETAPLSASQVTTN